MPKAARIFHPPSSILSPNSNHFPLVSQSDSPIYTAMDRDPLGGTRRFYA